MPGDPVIEVRGLVKRYGTLRAVDGIDLTVHRGEVFSFLGPNGAGKTTTVEVLEGLREPTEGTVRVLGMDPRADSARLIRRTGVIPQDFRFFEKITPREAIELYAGLFAHPKDPATLLRQVALEDKANDRFENLSGGQKQKLGLALALVNDPEVIFLDEPTTGLDPQARRAIWEVIRSLRTGGTTVFLTTHYLEEAQVLSDRVAIIHHGRIIALGTSEAIIQQYGRPEVLQLEAPASLAEYLRRALPLPVRVEGDRVEVEIGRKEDVLRVLTAVQASGIPWQRVSTTRDTLEDVFIRLVGRMDDGAVGAEPGALPAGGAP
jgi:ABC-2 type transport system ATP-binding protein